MNKEYILAAPYTHLHLALLSAPLAPLKIFPAENIFGKKSRPDFCSIKAVSKYVTFPMLEWIYRGNENFENSSLFENSDKTRLSSFRSLTFFKEAPWSNAVELLVLMETMPYTLIKSTHDCHVEKKPAEIQTIPIG
jgi:hypothetical protein